MTQKIENWVNSMTPENKELVSQWKQFGYDFHDESKIDFSLSQDQISGRLTACLEFLRTGKDDFTGDFVSRKLHI